MLGLVFSQNFAFTIIFQIYHYNKNIGMQFISDLEHVHEINATRARI